MTAKKRKSWSDLGSTEKAGVITGWVLMAGVASYLLAPGAEKSPNTSSSAPSAKNPVFTVNTDNSSILKALPATRMACPGLDRYSDQFQDVRVERLYRNTIVFHVPDASKIPGTYMAGGHNCFIELDADGKSIFIDKKACKSVCLDQLNTPDGQLKLALATDEEVKRYECLTRYDYDQQSQQVYARPKPDHCQG